MKLSFHGADRGVTGSCHLLEAAGRKILVDCGLYQGARQIEEENARAFGFDAAQIDFVLLDSCPSRSLRAAAPAHPAGFSRRDHRHRRHARFDPAGAARRRPAAGRRGAAPRPHEGEARREAGECRAALFAARRDGRVRPLRPNRPLWRGDRACARLARDLLRRRPHSWLGERSRRSRGRRGGAKNLVFGRSRQLRPAPAARSRPA